MQILYALGRDVTQDYTKGLLGYRRQVNQSFDLYLLVLFYLIKISNYASVDSKNRKTRLRPSPEDKLFKPILALNPYIKSLSENIGLYNLIDNHDIREKCDEDLVRLMYNEFLKTEDYKQFLQAEALSPDDYVNIYLNLLKTCLNSSHFQDVLEDNYSQWIDDESLVVGAVKKTLKQLPVATDFYKEYIPSEEATVEFGEFLLETVFFKDKELLDIISPNLQNWDAERVAVIDMILIKMAIAELMNFTSIPGKVTLNEYVEISKTYSTDKSKDFINGILDRLFKQLTEDQKITKEGRGLLDN
jgi:N utilization substance protein B